MKEIDGRGLQCPQPVILTKKALEETNDSEIIVIVDNEVARENIKRLVEGLALEYSIEEKEKCFYISIENRKDKKIHVESKDDVIIVISNDKLGSGDESLGEVLMKSYIYSLTEVAPAPVSIIFLNTGVRLTTSGSSVLDSLNKLYNNGVGIISCGTCLDYFGLKNELKIGVIGNMYSIVEIMHSGGKIINIG